MHAVKGLRRAVVAVLALGLVFAPAAFAGSAFDTLFHEYQSTGAIAACTHSTAATTEPANPGLTRRRVSSASFEDKWRRYNDSRCLLTFNSIPNLSPPSRHVREEVLRSAEVHYSAA